MRIQNATLAAFKALTAEAEAHNVLVKDVHFTKLAQSIRLLTRLAALLRGPLERG